MKQLKYFIAGILSITLIVPVLERLMEVFDLWVEVMKIRPSKKILNYQKDTTILREFTKPAEPPMDYEFEYVYGDEDDFDDED